MLADFDPLAAVSLGLVLVAFGGLVVLRRRGLGFTSLVLIALLLGVGVGAAFGGHLSYVEFLGDIYVQLITAVVAPLIFISVLSSVTSLGSVAKLRTIGLSSTLWLLATNAIAIVLTLAVVLTIGLGKGVQLDLAQSGADSLTGLLRPLDDVLLGLFPANLAGDFVGNNIVPIILFALVLAVAWIVASHREDPQLRAFKDVVDGTKKVVMTAVGFVVELTPYAVLALVASTTAVALIRIDTVLSLLAVLIVAFAVTFFDAYVVNGLLLRLVADVNPLRWFRLLTPAQYTAFTTQSSVGTLPITIPTLVRKVGVPEDVAAFAAPVGTTIGMPGCAGIWPIIVAVFSINVLGIDYSLTDYLVLAALCLLVSLGTAGVPGTAIITATAVLTAVGLPVEILVILVPISAVAGTASTMANVSAAATVATIVARRRGVLDDAVFRASPGDRRPGARAEAAGSSVPAADTAVLDAPTETVPVAPTRASARQSGAETEAIPLPDDALIGQCEIPPVSRASRTP
ncbi:dicarboxylate/amino acid:cation symporter [Microbacterium binotii]|uniref:dicarboxylate/amino acid:cation symporter n=1 Tax=Microbacterium binotii TaxID=462710 RepID=UPI001F301DCF|nr:dicarboxylate/amino acid:cation symporter [Microbacterium binotii]UIN30021.1 dicarboxylate/amino acid:cation symporter [Microbacterium binotii]